MCIAICNLNASLLRNPVIHFLSKHRKFIVYC
jgi:hypothetical protein